MNPWRSLRRELAGAWRSLRYDLTARHEPQHAVDASDDRPTVELHLDHEPRPRPRRRVLPAAGLGLLAAGGAAGTYLAVAGGLGALLTDASARPLPQTSRPAPTTTMQPPLVATQPVPIVTTNRATPSMPGRRGPLNAPPTPTPAPTCLCPTPPAPSPTPPGPTPDPSATPSPSPTVSLPPPTP